MEQSKKLVKSDFYYPLPVNDEDNPGDIEYEKILEKEIESNCSFNLSFYNYLYRILTL